MKYRNIRNAFIFVGARESVPPYGITRDYTDEEVEKTYELRYAIRERCYLIPDDGKSHKQAAPASPGSKAKFSIAPDTQGGEVVKKVVGKRVVEYVVSDASGVDTVENADAATDLVASIDGQKPADYIEEGVSAGKPTWQNASDAYEAELKKDTTDDIEYDDNEDLADGEEKKDEIADADAEIIKDHTQLLVDQGRMGASVESVPDMVEKSSSAAFQALNQATSEDFDDGEESSGASKDTSEFLRQPFSAKKWAIGKTTDKGFLDDVGAATKSSNLRSLVKQRKDELEAGS
jgi:hypothetical protein